MKKLLTLLLALSLPVLAEDAPAPADPAETTAPEAAAVEPEAAEDESTGERGEDMEVSAGDQADETPTPQPDDAITARPGNLKETVQRTLQAFTPSEEIDVDKPVDFPTNI